MSDSDTGSLNIEERNGAVLVTLSNSSTEIYSILPPQQALDVAEAIAKHAYHAQSGRDNIGRKIMQDVWMNKMINRVTMAIKKDQDDKKLPGYTAQKVLDIILKEVT